MSAFRVKNLRGTSGCSHYGAYKAFNSSTTKCAVNGCPKDATRACHVISANQNSKSGVRKIVYMCPSHNATYDVLDIRSNAQHHELPGCHCGSE